MNSVEDKLNEAFDIVPEEGTPQDIVPSSRNMRGVPAKVDVESNPDDRGIDTKTDYELVRETLHNLLIRGNDALECAIDTSKEQSTPRAYEVVSGMMKQMSEVSLSLLDLQDRMNRITGEEAPKTVNQTMNVTLTTAELQKMLNSD